MNNQGTPQDILRAEANGRPQGGVWAVRDYHTTLEKRAIAGAEVTPGYFYMVVAATVMARPGCCSTVRRP